MPYNIIKKNNKYYLELIDKHKIIGSSTKKQNLKKMIQAIEINKHLSKYK